MNTRKYTPFLIIFMVVLLTGCTYNQNPIVENEFSMTFDELNLEENTTDFTIIGYPNDDEKEQIINIINDSLEDVEDSDVIEVNLHSDLEENSEEPFFGTLKYENGELNGEINNKTEEEYLEIAHN